MFIKVSTSGGHRYARLVESFRNENGDPRQRTLAQLGRLTPGGDVDRLIRALLVAQGRDTAVLDEPGTTTTSAAAPDLQFQGARAVGDVWALWQVWQSLDFDALRLAWSRSRSGLDVVALLRTMVFNRLCDPGSKLGVLRWLQTVALPVDFGVAAGDVEHQHLLRAMDVLDEHADAVAERLSVLMRPLIDQELSVVFYDLTTVTVHGEATCDDGDDADVREWGRAKEGMVARQFMLSLVQTADGLPIAHAVHPGNTAEAGTLLPMIRQLLDRWPLKRVVLVADRGLLSLSNLAELERLQAELDAAGRGVVIEHVLAVPAARYGEFRDEIAALDDAHDASQPWVDETRWTTGKPGDPSNPERRLRLVVAHDPLAAQRRTQARRAEIAELVALGEQWGGRLDAQDAGERRRGRPLSDAGAKARLYQAVKDASLAHLIKVDMRSDLFSFAVDEARLRYLERLDGKLLLVTNTTTPAEDVVRRYKSLADIERGFRALKSEIEIGPVYHRLPRRIRAHALVCFIALIVHRVLRMRLRTAGRAESPRLLLELLSRVQHQAARTGDGQVVHGISELAPLQRELFAAIGAKPPTPDQIATEATV